MQTPEELASLLDAELKQRNWSIKDLAREAGVTFEVVRRVVRGQSAPSWPTVNKILLPIGKKLTLLDLPVTAEPRPTASAEEVPA